MPKVTSKQLREVMADRLDLKTDQEVKAAVSFFNACVDFIMARSKNPEQVLNNSENVITMISGCLTLFKDIAEKPAEMTKQYDKFLAKHNSVVN